MSHSFDFLRSVSEVIWITSFYWKGLEYQPHHFARQFIKQGVPVIFTERSPHRWPRLGLKDPLEWFFRTGQGASEISKEVPEGIHVICPRILPPSRWLRPLNRMVIKETLNQLGLKSKKTHGKPLIITNVPSYNTVDLIHAIGPCTVIYINVHNYDADIVIMPDILKGEKEVISLSDMLFADSTCNMKRLSRLSNGRSVYPSLPGVDYERFHQVSCRDEPDQLRTLYYFGGIKQELDLPLYGALAAKFKVVFVGVVDPGVRKHISGNIEIRPPVANSELPEILKDADILALFYKDSPFVRGVIPAKFFECLATGKPVLVSGLSEAKPYLDVVYDVQGSEQKAIEVIKNLPDTETESRLHNRDALAKEADWPKRFESFISNLNTSLSDKAHGSLEK